MNKLEEIIEAHRSTARSDDRKVDELMAEAVTTPPPRDFKAAVQVAGLSLVAEIKRRSPSAGDINTGLDPAAVARDYEEAGASCISVLTDERYFGGSIYDLRAARAAVDLPILRKDFTVDERDIIDARLMGADAVLLIVAALSDSELTRFHTLASELGLCALVEVHDESELERAVSSGADVIGVNQRNLADFSIDRELAARLHPMIPEGCVSVAESGIRNGKDAAILAMAGYDAVLAGTSIVSAGDMSAMIREITGR